MNPGPAPQRAARGLQAPGEDALTLIRDRLREARDTQLAIETLEAEVKRRKARLNELQHRELPDLFAANLMTHHGIEAEGNYPAFSAQVRPYYKAVISAEWPQEQQDAAFALLEQREAGDLIKNVVSVEFGREENESCAALLSTLREAGYAPTVKRSVMWNTLTAWVKEQITKYKAEFSEGELERLGAQVGRIVEVKPVKEEKY